MKILLIVCLLFAASCANKQVTKTHDPRCYANGVFDPDLGADDLDCANE